MRVGQPEALMLGSQEAAHSTDSSSLEYSAQGNGPSFSRWLLVCFLPGDVPLFGILREQSLMVCGLLHLASVTKCDVL